ncbi:HD domain-containing protein (plasmid) [Rhizobium sp. RCAM05350]|nr:HD domain-containing protein [Rhizobium sp. RCAM05350]
MESNPAALIGITRLKTKDEYTFLHSIAVSALMVHFARFLKFDEPTVRVLGVSGLLHDIGKMVMPDALLSKKSALTDEEMAEIRTHPVRGYNCYRARATCRRRYSMSAFIITSGSTARAILLGCRTSRSVCRRGSRRSAMSMMQ